MYNVLNRNALLGMPRFHRRGSNLMADMTTRKHFAGAVSNTEFSAEEVSWL